MKRPIAPVPVTRDLLKAIEGRVERELDDPELRYWPFLKDWLLKLEYQRATQVDGRGKSGAGLRVAIKLVPALIISMLAFGAICVRVRRAPHGAVVFSATSRLERASGGPLDEFVECATALEGTAVPALYYTSPDQLLNAPLAWQCHENLLVRLQLMIARLFRSVRGREKEHHRAPRPIATLVVSETGLEDGSVDAVIAEFDARVRVYRFLLKLLRPRHVYVVSAYTKTDLVHAARGLRIGVTELQHGLLAPFHPSYAYTEPGRGWDEALPHRLVVKNEFWERTQRRFAYADVLTCPLATATPPLDTPGRQRPFLLFTGQGIAYDSIAGLVAELRSSPDHAGIDFVYACHPTEDPDSVRGHIGAREDSRVVVEPFVSSAHTLNLIATAEKHMSVYSSCHIDALEIHGATFILRAPGFSSQIELFEGIDGAHFFDDLKELDGEQPNA